LKIKNAYNEWASTYDSMSNKTRDIEANALVKTLHEVEFRNVLEIGCGTGKNTEWLARKAEKVTAVDFSEEMLKNAASKTRKENVVFIEADVTGDWMFSENDIDLVTCSLILEHINDINHIFEQASSVLKSGGHFYIGELHPYRQYMGVKARFENGDVTHEIESFIHNISDFFKAGSISGLSCVELSEWFDEENVKTLPRLISLLYRKH